MSFRDEQESQRARAEALAAELAERERELAAKDRELQVLKEQLARPERAREGRFRGALRVTLERLRAARQWLRGKWAVALGVIAVCGVVVGAGLVGDSCATDSPLEPAMTVEVERVATVLDTQGRAAFTPGTACSVRVTSAADPEMNCRAFITCGGMPLYGEPEGMGFLRCTFDASKAPIAGTDLRTTAEDGDPELILDLAHDRVEVRDGVGAESWSVTLSLGAGSTRRVPLP